MFHDSQPCQRDRIPDENHDLQGATAPQPTDTVPLPRNHITYSDPEPTGSDNVIIPQKAIQPSLNAEFEDASRVFFRLVSKQSASRLQG